MWEFETFVDRVTRRTPSILSFRFPIRARNVRYRPGQFFFVTIKIAGEDAVHHFTISSSPTEKGYLEFTKRITEHEYSQVLARMQPGDWARLQGPSGEFTLPAAKSKLGFLAGGIGITPARSMFRYIADKGLPYDLSLLYSNSTLEEICFREELEAISLASPLVRVVHVLGTPPPNWQGPSGRIRAEIIKEFIPDYGDRIFYVSGPPSMVLSLEDQLLSLGLPTEQIKRDAFTGYD
jgi:ferredoxin-NADP reductase